MKQLLWVVVLLFNLCTYAQKETTSSLEKNTYNIQTGLLGLWLNNETRITNEVTLRTELGLNGGFTNSDFIFVPGISLEPRWYFNIDQRNQKGKNTGNNAANYWSLKTLYLSDSFILSTDDSLELTSDQLNITLNWGIKRNLNKNWHYELGIGLGIDALYDETNDNSLRMSGDNIVGDLTLRIGYTL